MKRFFSWTVFFQLPSHPPVRWLWLSFAVIVADQFSKLLVLYYLHLYQQIHLLPVLNLTLLYNRGAAFSLLASASGWQRWLFVGLACAFALAIIIVLHRLPRQGRSRLAAALSLIAGGALGNAIDRVWHHHVIDFIQVHYDKVWYFPAFNVADSCITIGAILVLIDAVFERKTVSHKPEANLSNHHSGDNEIDS